MRNKIAYDREGSEYCVFTGLVSSNTVRYCTQNSFVMFFLIYLGINTLSKT